MLPLITSTVKIHGRRLLLLIAAISITSSAWANGLPTANPESVGVSSERLGRLSESMQRYVIRFNSMSTRINWLAPLL